MAPMAPEHLGSMVLLQSWPLPLAQRAHAPGKIHNFQRSEVWGGGCSLKKAMWAKAWVGKCCVVFVGLFLSQCSDIYFVGYHISSVTTVISDVWWWLHSSWLENFAAESNRMKQPDHFCLPSNLRLQLRGTLPLRHLLCPSVVSLLAADFWLRPFHATECLKECPQLQVSYEIHNSPVWSEGWNLP